MASKDRSSSLSSTKARRMAIEIISHHFKKKPLRILQKTSGLSNLVFQVKISHDDYVVRVSPDQEKINLFIKEQWAVSKVRGLGVPSPEILEVGNEVVPYPYMISRRVEGRDATYHPKRLEILFELGRYAALINSIPTNGFGGTFDWSNNQLSRNNNWREFVVKELKLQERLSTLKKYRMLPDIKLKKLRSILLSPSKTNIKPHLNHGDLRLKNVIVDKQGKISAIIDWEQCSSNYAPCWELSLALHDLTIDEKENFIEGYGITPQRLRKIMTWMKAINIVNYAPHIQHRAEKKDLKRLEQIRFRLSGDLDLYSL